MLSIKEQEDFMHMIYDCIHIGVSLESLHWLLKSYKEFYGEEFINILNQPMKNEKYSNNFILPLYKVITETASHLDIDNFFNRKLEGIKMLVNYGCKIELIRQLTIDWEILLKSNIINDEIQALIDEVTELRQENLELQQQLLTIVQNTNNG